MTEVDTTAGEKRPEAGRQDSRIARTRADVGRAALHLLVEEGSQALTHARVAEVAGYSKSTLYTRWPNRSDLAYTAFDALGDMPHQERSGDLRSDLVAELKMFRRAVIDRKLDRVLAAMAEWATFETMRELRNRINTEAQRPIRGMLEGSFTGARLEAAISMLAGVVACPSLMFGTVPDDAVIEAAVDVVLSSDN
ncbi:TetR/AcrR family transcriptional regulator [Mycolicibacterium lacusdiani]|uniref:TetR/AcrR family transcriptional regulator n=1 Tax=Mycolicibacterium lacusdiani TaxID=2895283 RepID=UPI001F1C25BC|nr:TetR family transcriptional regulator [Mycolicibacterium lacusdiani]